MLSLFAFVHFKFANKFSVQITLMLPNNLIILLCYVKIKERYVSSFYWRNIELIFSMQKSKIFIAVHWKYMNLNWVTMIQMLPRQKIISHHVIWNKENWRRPKDFTNRSVINYDSRISHEDFFVAMNLSRCLWANWSYCNLIRFWHELMNVNLDQ